MMFIARHRRRSIRLRGYDYARAGAYFVTICTQDRVCLFGDVVDGAMRLNDAGRIVHSTWSGLPNHYRHVSLDAFVIMPNHVHGIIVVKPSDAGADDVRAGIQPTIIKSGDVGAGFKPAPTEPRACLSEVVRALKTFSARHINESRATPGVPVWQRNYYEHIIRDEQSLNRVRQYIHDNPAQWAWDHENPMFEGSLPTIEQIEAELGAKMGRGR